MRHPRSRQARRQRRHPDAQCARPAFPPSVPRRREVGRREAKRPRRRRSTSSRTWTTSTATRAGSRAMASRTPSWRTEDAGATLVARAIGARDVGIRSCSTAPGLAGGQLGLRQQQEADQAAWWLEAGLEQQPEPGRLGQLQQQLGRWPEGGVATGTTTRTAMGAGRVAARRRRLVRRGARGADSRAAGPTTWPTSTGRPRRRATTREPVFYIGESTTGPSEHFIGTPRRECGAIGGQALFRAASQERTEPVTGKSGSSNGEEGEDNYPVSSLVEATGLRGGTVQHALSFLGENQKAGSLGPPIRLDTCRSHM